MTFLPMADLDALTPEAQSAVDRELPGYGASLGNLNATLLSHPPGFTAYLQAHALHDALVPFVGERAASLFAYAIADESQSLHWVSFYRRILIGNGEDPDHPDVTETEQLLIDWGRRIAADPAGISADFYDQLERAFHPQLRLLLVAFAGQVIANSVVTSVGKIPLDPEFYEFRKPGDLRTN